MTITDARPAAPKRSPPGTALHGLYDSMADFLLSAYRASLGQGDEKISQVWTIQNAMSERVPADGGYLVPEEYREDLVLASLEHSIIRPAAKVFPMQSLRAGFPAVDETTHSGSLLGGWTASWVAEGALITDTTPGLHRDFAEAKKLAAFTTVNNELFEDAAALRAFVSNTLPQAIAWFEDDAFIAGTGQGEPKGVITSNCAVSVSRTSGSVQHPDVVAMLKRMWPQGWQSGTARFLGGPDTLGVLIDIFQNFGAATQQAMANNPQLWYDVENKCWRLFGVPLTVTEHTAAAGTLGDLVLIDPSAYVIADREVMQIRISPHPKWNQDQSVIRVIHRVDGRTWPNSPVTPVSGAATVSPVVVLT
jgi:HK97 family phage major capsid protein